MAILIDGYNLLHASDIVGGGPGETVFEQSRNALIAFVAGSVAAKQRKQTRIIFDAAEAPPGLPSQYRQHGVGVRFAKGYRSADALLEELIAAERDPRNLLVVSSDHRVQRAARRNGARYVDSEIWYRQQQRRLREAESPPSEPYHPLKQAELDDEEVRAWLNEFRQGGG